MKRETEEKLTDVGNSPVKNELKRQKIFSGPQASKSAFLFNSSASSQENISLFLKWKKQWNEFLILYLYCLVSTENNHIYIPAEYNKVKKAKNSLGFSNLDVVYQSPYERSVITALRQCDSFDCYLSLKNKDLLEIPSVLDRISLYDKLILGTYKIVKISLEHADTVLNDLSANPTFAEYSVMLQDLEENILPAFNDHVANISVFPAAIDKKIRALKSTPLQAYFIALLEDRKQSFIQQIENLNVRKTMITIFIDEIKAEMQKLDEEAVDAMTVLGAGSVPSNTAPGI